MAIPQETLPANDYNQEHEEGVATWFDYGWSSCFGRFCWPRRKVILSESTSSRYQILMHNEDRQEMITDQDRNAYWLWLVEKVKRIREVTEILAGPKWKNFIRRFNKKRTRNMQLYHYDLQSYALNFDERNIVDDRDHADSDFSARFGSSSIPYSSSFLH